MPRTPYSINPSPFIAALNEILDEPIPPKQPPKPKSNSCSKNFENLFWGNPQSKEEPEDESKPTSKKKKSVTPKQEP